MAHLKEAHLVLFFTRGISLKTWNDVGMLDREVALYRALRQHLRAITFVTYGDVRDLRHVKQLNGIRIICNILRLPQRLYSRVLSDVYPMLWEGPVVFKSNQIPGADVALEASRRFRKKFIARCGYLYSEFMEREHGSSSRQAQRARILERKVFTAADRVVVTTLAMRHSVVQRYQIPAEHVIVIPNYIETSLFRPISNGSISLKRICFVGRLEEQKNLFALLEAVRGLDVELVMVGSGRLSERLRKEVNFRGLAVRFLGNVQHRELPKILNNAEAFVLPSFYEGHPKALLEAMACGLPVIGTDVPGIREIIRHRETGFLCGTSSDEIRAAIQETLSDRDLRTRMARNAREFIVEHFTLEQVVKMELALLKDVLRE